MKQIFEWLLPALAEFGISENFANTKDREKSANSEGDGVGVVDGPAHDASASSDQDGDEKAVHDSGRLEFKSATNGGPVVQRVQLLNGDAGSQRDRSALPHGHVADGAPVLKVLAAEVATKAHRQAGAAAAHRNRSSNPGVVLLGDWKLFVCSRIGPTANIAVVQALEPLVFVSGGRGFGAASNQRRFTAHYVFDMGGLVVRNKVNAEATDASNVRSNARHWVDRPTNLDVAVTEEADVEGFHLRRLEFRPHTLERGGKEVLTPNLAAGVALDEHGQLGRGSARSISAVPQMPDRRFALGGEVIPGLIGVEGFEVGSEVHGASTP